MAIKEAFNMYCQFEKLKKRILTRMRKQLCISRTCEDMDNIAFKYIFEMNRLYDIKIKVGKLIDKLKKKDRQICIDYYCHNINYGKIVEKYSISIRTFMRRLKTINELWDKI